MLLIRVLLALDIQCPEFAAKSLNRMLASNSNSCR